MHTLKYLDTRFENFQSFVDHYRTAWCSVCSSCIRPYRECKVVEAASSSLCIFMGFDLRTSMAVNIGFNDPLYIHPSDSPDMSLITDQLIGAANYDVWSRSMLIALRAKNKTGFIDRTCKRPAIEQATLHQ